jgi:probable RNA-binding protein EIF1AD
MPRPRRDLIADAESASSPPAELTPSQTIARVVKACGNNLYSLELPSKSVTTGETILAELPSQFRSTLWIIRGGYVVVDTQALAGRENKIGGQIVNVVRDEKVWRKEKYWQVIRYIPNGTMLTFILQAQGVRQKIGLRR